MTNWAYQSTNPCTVLVKEKQDGSIPQGCPPPVLQPSTETVASSQDQPEISSSLGNSVGGKKTREKRQAHEDGVDVVFDNGEEHADKEPLFEPVEKRILVNISIAMDKGLGTLHQEVYQLQVAVPLPKEDRRQHKFYSYEVDRLMEANEAPTEMDDIASIPVDIAVTRSNFLLTESNDDESSTTSFDEFITLSSPPEGLKN